MQKGLVTGNSISPKLAQDMVDVAYRVAIDERISGFVVITNAGGMILAIQAVGNPITPNNLKVAIAKAETVFGRRQSTQVFKDLLKEKNVSGKDVQIGDYAGAVKTRFGGGLAVFSDSGCADFVGVIAFSGGSEEQDRAVCQEAIRFFNLFTDDPPINNQ
jgi:uncharacterized protein GlcG (DUF336 family)